MRPIAIRIGVCAWIVMTGWLVGTIRAQVSQPSLQSALAQRTQQLGACNTELGPLQQLLAQVLNGQIASVADTTAKIKAQFEQANPSKSWDAQMKLIDAPKKGTP